MERGEAGAIYDAGREVVVEVLLRMDRRIQQLEARVERLERELKKELTQLLASAELLSAELPCAQQGSVRSQARRPGRP